MRARTRLRMRKRSGFLRPCAPLSSAS